MIKKALEIIAILVIIAVLIFAGDMGYNYYKEWKQDQKSSELKLIETLKANQGMIIKLTSDLAETQKKVIGDTLKETTVVKEEAPTYKAKKEEIIELKKEPEANAEKIEVAREEFEKRIDEFQASDDKILVNTGEKKIVIYEDESGNLVSLDSGVIITRHQNVDKVINELEAGAVVVEKGNSPELAFGVIYDLEDKGFYPGISYQLFDWKKLSLNITGYNFESIKAGLDVCYNISGNIIVGAGARIFDTEGNEFSLDKYYLKAGIQFVF